MIWCQKIEAQIHNLGKSYLEYAINLLGTLAMEQSFQNFNRNLFEKSPDESISQEPKPTPSINSSVLLYHASRGLELQGNKMDAEENKRTVKRRTKADTEDRLYKCNLCTKSYLSYPALYTHTKNKHNMNTEVSERGALRGRGRPRKVNICRGIGEGYRIGCS